MTALGAPVYLAHTQLEFAELLGAANPQAQRLIALPPRRRDRLAPPGGRPPGGVVVLTPAPRTPLASGATLLRLTCPER